MGFYYTPGHTLERSTPQLMKWNVVHYHNMNGSGMQRYKRLFLPKKIVVNWHPAESKILVHYKWNFPQIIMSLSSAIVPTFIEFQSPEITPHICDRRSNHNATILSFLLPLTCRSHRLTDFDAWWLNQQLWNLSLDISGGHFSLINCQYIFPP